MPRVQALGLASFYLRQRIRDTQNTSVLRTCYAWREETKPYTIISYLPDGSPDASKKGMTFAFNSCTKVRGSGKGKKHSSCSFGDKSSRRFMGMSTWKAMRVGEKGNLPFPWNIKRVYKSGTSCRSYSAVNCYPDRTSRGPVRFQRGQTSFRSLWLFFRTKARTYRSRSPKRCRLV